jgi:hypothetical protein
VDRVITHLSGTQNTQHQSEPRRELWTLLIIMCQSGFIDGNRWTALVQDDTEKARQVWEQGVCGNSVLYVQFSFKLKTAIKI